MYIIAVTNAKGGVGKTTTSGSLAAGLAELGHQVLLVDEDEQCDLTGWFGVSDHDPHNFGAFLLAKPAQVASWPTVEVRPGLHLMPSHELLGDYLEKARRKDEPHLLLRTQLARLKKGRFDFVVLDCPPGMVDGVTFNAFCAANAFVLATNPEPFSFKALQKLMNRAQAVQQTVNPALVFAGFVFPQFNPEVRGKLRQQIYAGIAEHFGAESILGHVRQCVAMPEAQAKNQSIFDYDPESTAALDYRHIISQLLARIAQ